MDIDDTASYVQGDTVGIGSCFNEDGSINVDKYRLYAEQEDALLDLEESELQTLYQEEEEAEGNITMSLDDETRTTTTTATGRRKRRCKSIKPYYFDDEGNKIVLQPKQTIWYIMYVVSPTLDCQKFNHKFRRRFRMPYQQFLRMVDWSEDAQVFQRWRSKDAVGNSSSPLELMILGALRYLGRGLTFDDLEEYTAINEETHRQFFHVFITWGQDWLFPKFVRMPTTAAEYKAHQGEFNVAGLPGAGFSTDATNVIMWRCSHNLRQSNMGFKQSTPARTYNLTANHRHRILYTTRGHPSRWNDKTLAHFDEFMTGLHDGTILQDVTFHLFSWEGEVGKSSLEATKYSGAWGLVDNGYHKWACTQAPAKFNLLRSEERLSQWIESMRKDVECTFGILKGRWRILKTGIRLDGPEAADKTWLTCCALHNMLLECDGLDEWNGSVGENDVVEMRRHAPFAIQRLADDQLMSFGSRDHEQQCVMEEQQRRAVNRQRGQLQEEEDGVGEIAQESDDHLSGRAQQLAIDGSVRVNSLTYDDFRNRLVEHFDIQFRRHRVRWPERQRQQQQQQSTN
ncbi:Plant transposon protein [Seminavis robusta]|uniref:Plant transposon protein n=1 Tax=Seminavis robusta TaxID=568900 RepID=A0A9N8HA79_9STRA|nr:Plant transposon protein [Seminavis robusta]|eukprot:Sro139_g065030.1 Plant transposon protein (569) ;mRNA; r:30045-31751